MRTQYLVATAAILNPIHMVALGNGQWENVAVWPILLSVMALRDQRWLRFALGLYSVRPAHPIFFSLPLSVRRPF